MLFFRRKKSSYPAVAGRSGRPAGAFPGDSSSPGDSAPFIRIEFEMMRKGNIVERRGQKIRQYLVSVDGSTRLVNSGDVVDRATYNALVAAGCIVPQEAPASVNQASGASPDNPPETD
ncbi:MAG TPA: hypothetical protein PLX03_00030 [Candidatus Hydrogenedentes bacterium]|nr:hypothetical protein [Candidatus Hydrogenedentota bacterium]